MKTFEQLFARVLQIGIRSLRHPGPPPCIARDGGIDVRPLTPSLSPSEGERVPAGRVRGIPGDSGKFHAAGVSGLAGTVWLLAFTAAGSTAAEFPAGWKSIQTITVDRSDWIRFSLPLETMDAARPRLEDLRIYDDQGREVPFALERPVQRAGSNRAPKKFNVVVQASTTVVTLETGSTQPLSGLTLQTPAREFLKGMKVEGSHNGSDWTLIADGVPVFKQGYGAAQLRLNWPAGVWSFLRLTLDDRRSAPIPVTGATLQFAGQDAPTETLDATILGRAEADGETRLELRLGGANVTLASLTLLANDTVFNRAVTLVQQTMVEGEVKEGVVTRGSVYRLALPGHPAVSNLSFALDVPVHSRELALIIRNDDDSPLDISGIRAARRPVYITLRAPPAGALHLLSGNAQCLVPRYDLATLRDELKGAANVKVAAEAIHANPAYQTPDPLAAIAISGSALDVSAWRFRKPVRVAAAGIQQLELDLEVLAHAVPGLSDLRLLASGRQVPYLVERTSLQRKIAVTAARADDLKRPRVSRWSLDLPDKRLPAVRLTCETKTPLFRRDVLLYEEVPDERGEKHRVVVGQASWVRTPEQKSGRLSVNLGIAPATDQLWLEIENGDNPPLELAGFSLWYPATRLLFKPVAEAPAMLYYGNSRVMAPRYDLDLVAGRILSAEKSKASLGSEERLKESSLGETLGGGKGNWIFLSVLGGVVAGLLYLLARLLPKVQG